MVQNSLTLDQPRQMTPTATSESMMTRQAQEVQAAMVVAKRFPRDVDEAIRRIEKACERTTLAEAACYEYERAGGKITGPSIRLAETLAQNWGNLDFGVVELEQRNGESSVMAYAWDLETNTRQTKIFQVPHIRKTKQGSKLLDDPRDVYEMVANQGARRLRACILGIIPGDIVDFAVSKCEQTVANGQKKIPLTERVNKMVAAFAAIEVSAEQLAQFIGKESTNNFAEADLNRLRKVYAAIKDNLTRKEDQFPPVSAVRPAPKEEPVQQTLKEDEFPL